MDTSVLGGSGREAHPHVFVLDKHHQPLMPCHPARARKLLASGRAVVVHATPLVIRLKDRTVADSVVEGVQIAIDPGSKYTGIAVFATGPAQTGKETEVEEEPGTARRGMFGIQLRHRGGRIRDKLTARAVYRRRRRSVNLRFRPSRIDNRARPEGWLAPSLRHRVDTTTSWVRRLRRWAPVTAIHLERVAFDTHLLQYPGISGVEYQQGTLHGTEAREYLLAKWGRRCAYCDAAGVPLNLDHLQPRCHGGSNRVSNLTLACVPCNQAKGSRLVQEFLAGQPKRLVRILAQAKAPLRAAAAVNATRWALWHALMSTGLPVHAATGGRTKWNRTRNHLPKSHTLDALCVGQMSAILRVPNGVLAVAATGRGSYQRTRPDAFGFPRLRLPRVKTVRGFQTGDLVCALVPSGKRAGRHVGRVAVRTSGRFNIRIRAGLVQGVHHRHCRVLQRADGYGYHWEEERASSLA